MSEFTINVVVTTGGTIDADLTGIQTINVDVVQGGTIAAEVIGGGLGPQGPQGDTGATGAQGPQGDPGEGVPIGGTLDQVLIKLSGSDYDTDWHTLVKDDVGLGNVDNTSDVNKPVSTAQAAADAVVQADLDAHEADTSNPHSVTKSQVGLGNVDNVQQQPIDADLTTIAAMNSATSGVIASEGAGWVQRTYAQLKTLLALVKGDVGLGNVDNTSDANKPVSTATQTALDAKVTGPASATDNAIARYDGTTGKLVQDSSVSISDTGQLGVGITSVSKAHIYQNSSDTGVGGGLTIEQAGAGDALLQFLTTGIRRWYFGIDKSDSSRLKISASGLGTSDAFAISSDNKVGINGATHNYMLNVYSTGLAARLQFQSEAGSNPGIELTNDTSGTRRVLMRLNESGSSGTEFQFFTRPDAGGAVVNTLSMKSNGDLVITGALLPTTDLAIDRGGTGASTAADARTNLGLGSIAVLSTITEANITLADNTTNDFSTTKHGFVPKGTNVGNFLKDDGTWAAIPGGGDALTSNPLSQFAATTSAQLRGVLSDETGTGAAVFANSPALVTPTGIVKGDVGLGNVDNTSNATERAASATLTNKTFDSTSPTAFNPSGIIQPYAGKTVPTGWLACDGSAVSRSTYSGLFAAICESVGTFTVTIASPAVVTLTAHGLQTGDQVYLTTTGALPTGLTANTLYYAIRIDANTFNLATSRANAYAGTKINTSGTQSGTHTLRWCPYGLGDGSTTFNVPDFRGRVPAGNDSQGGTVASRLTLSRSQGSYGNVGSNGGEQAHTLIQDEMPGFVYAGGAGGYFSQLSAAVAGSAGGGLAQNNVQPTLVVNYIIKT